MKLERHLVLEKPVLQLLVQAELGRSILSRWVLDKLALWRPLLLGKTGLLVEGDMR